MSKRKPASTSPRPADHSPTATAYESAPSRALRDLRILSQRWWFRVAAGAISLGFIVWGALIPDAAPALRVAVAVGGSLGGTLIIGLTAFSVLLATAAARQRNDAREALKVAEDDAVAARAQAEEGRAQARVAADARVSSAERERDIALRRAETVQLLPHAIDLDDILRAERAVGKRLLAEATSLEPIGNMGVLDDLQRREQAWIDRVRRARRPRRARDA